MAIVSSLSRKKDEVTQREHKMTDKAEQQLKALEDFMKISLDLGREALERGEVPVG